MTAPAPLWVVALRDGQAPRREAFAGARGVLVRVGGSQDDDVPLDGCDRVAELVSTGAGWLVKTAGSPLREVEDGASVQLGAWRVFLFVAGPESSPDVMSGMRRLAESLAARERADDLPSLSGAGAPPFVLAGAAPAVVGNARGCDVSPGGRASVWGVVWRDAVTGRTSFYPALEGLFLAGGEPAVAPVTLRDGETVRDGAGGELVFRDPQESIDRLLESLLMPTEGPPAGGESGPPPDPPRRGRPWIGEDAEALVSAWELALWCAGAAALAGFLCVYAARF